MTPLLEHALANAALAVPLALLAWASSAVRRPALTHALWLLVLLRLVAPPLWRVPLPSWPAAGPTAVEAQPIALAPTDPPEPRTAALLSPPPWVTLTPPVQPAAAQPLTTESAAPPTPWPWQQPLAAPWP